MLQRLLRSSLIQAKLRIGEPNDEYEQEADRIAEQVMTMPEPRSGVGDQGSGVGEGQSAPVGDLITPLVQRQAGSGGQIADSSGSKEDEKKEEEPVQTKAFGAEPVLQRQEAEEEEKKEEEPVQAKLQCSKPTIQPQMNDEEEKKEEEPVQTMSLGSVPVLQPQEAGDEEEKEDEPVQTKSVSRAPRRGSSAVSVESPAVSRQPSAVSPSLASRIHALKVGGQPLDPATRAFFEPCFGRDFSQVRVHTDANAAETARALSARSFTINQDVIFGAGEHAPDSADGRKLLAHELAHVVQQHGRQQTTDELFTIARKKKTGAEQIYEALFVKPPTGKARRKWRDKATRSEPTTSADEIMSKFRSALANEASNPMKLHGITTEKTSKSEMERLALEARHAIVAKFGSHIATPSSEEELPDRVQALTEAQTSQKSYIKEWVASRLFSWTTVGDYCIGPEDKRVQAVINAVLADPEMEGKIRILAGRQTGFTTETGGVRTVYINPRATPKQVSEMITHEMVHLLAHEDYRVWNAQMAAPPFVHEGFTEYLARCVTGFDRKHYQNQYQFIHDEVAPHTTDDAIAAAYFEGKVWSIERISAICTTLFDRSKAKSRKKQL